MTTNLVPFTAITDDTAINIETITPEIAAEYLTHNTHNRNLRRRDVLAYADDIRSGAWTWNGEAIKFADDGTLLDGQHRLHAIIEAGIAVRMLVVRGLPKDTQHTMDTGVSRKFSDVLKLRGESSYVSLASTVRGIYALETAGRIVNRGKATNAQLLATLDKYPWLRDGMTTVNRVSMNAALPTSIAGPLWWMFVQIDAADTEDFFARLCTGEGRRGEPIWTLHKSLADSRKSVRGTRNTEVLAAITIKAWNAYRAGREVGLLRWVPGGATPEAFPVAK